MVAATAGNLILQEGADFLARNVLYLPHRKETPAHLIRCWCQRCEEQLYCLRETVSAFPEHADKSSDARLSPSSKTRIK